METMTRKEIIENELKRISKDLQLLVSCGEVLGCMPLEDEDREEMDYYITRLQQQTLTTIRILAGVYDEGN